MDIRPGSSLAQYEILTEIGAGGMGVVYRAYDRTLQRTVAIKLLSTAQTGGDARSRLLHEARSASALNHPNICTIYEVGYGEPQSGVGRGGPTSDAAKRGAGVPAMSHTQMFIVMEYVEGRPLSELIPGSGLPVESVARYGGQISDALAHAHDRGVVHRDLKTSNVVVTSESRAKVLDFGLARRLPGEDVEAIRTCHEITD